VEPGTYLPDEPGLVRMDAALGPPEAMVDSEEDLTPMIRQYVETCRRYDDCLVLFHVGDFYKSFEAAAETVARRCELTLTSREDNSGEYTMAGIPLDSAESYIDRLLDAGYRVAVAEQVEDPEQVSGVADRQVTRVVTPGTLTEDELLDGDDHNFLAALAAGDEGYGLAVLDVSTGDCYATAVPDRAGVRDEVGRFAPAEAVVGPDVPDAVTEAFAADCAVTAYDPAAFDREAAAERVADYFGAVADAAPDGEVRAVGGLLAYAEYARGGQAGRLAYLNHLTRYDPRAYMLLDAVALRSLEVFERRSVRGAEGAALVDVVDETACALGRRALTDWLRRPLLDEDRIVARHEAVGELKRSVGTRERLQDLLSAVYDVERLVSRVARGRANARDLRSLKATLDVVPDVADALADAEAPLLRELRDDLDPLADVRERVGSAIAPDPPVELTEGGIIREGYSDDLDALRAAEREGKAWVEDLQASERERTGIDSLKVGHNAVHGYYIEVTDPNVDAVPEDYHRRQTLKNAERYYTPELKEREEEILEAEHRAQAMEYDLFVAVRDAVAAEAERVQSLADALARLDALAALGEVAAAYGYTRPEVGADRFDVDAGRHPVVERTQASFVPNDTDFDAGEVAVVTGPNMSGKSTYMRQVALLAVLAQAGSFVPAESARLPVVDRVFTRVGASDDIAGGQSTFMVEMVELAEILEGATEASLVLLDEVGRGTSTADGLAIARAVTEHVHDEVGATTLFATHHHELTELAADLPRARNLHFSARQEGGEVVFDHAVAEGAATASYGVEVASEAGVPDAVVDRARDLLPEEATPDDAAQVTLDEVADDPAVGRSARAADGAGDLATLVDRLEALDLANTTPVEALNALADLKDLVEDG
jgi:DNA mismatch repair protein MutS